MAGIESIRILDLTISVLSNNRWQISVCSLLKEVCALSNHCFAFLHLSCKTTGLSQKHKTGAAAGTPFWMAPELLRGTSANTAASDVYAFGIILYEVFSRKDPYEGEDAKEVMKLVADPKVNKRPPIPRNCPPLVEGLMTDCLVEDPQERPTAEEISIRLKRMDISKVETGEAKNKATISLFDIFPKQIAEALRDGREVESEHKDMVTIFFSDIVGFVSRLFFSFLSLSSSTHCVHLNSHFGCLFLFLLTALLFSSCCRRIFQPRWNRGK